MEDDARIVEAMMITDMSDQYVSVSVSKLVNFIVVCFYSSQFILTFICCLQGLK